MTRALLVAALALLAACSEPVSTTEAEAPPAPAIVCNALAPDAAKLVNVEDEAAASLPNADLRGGTIAPGVYDLTRAVRIGGATGWRGGSAVTISVNEGEAGAVLNWSAITPAGARDTWTATLTDARLIYACGRIGDVPASYVATEGALDLRIQDGAGGALHLVFARRA